MEIYFSPPEIVEWVNENQLKERYDITYKGDGWYKIAGNDYALVIQRHYKYNIFVWVRQDPRDEFEKVLDLPIYGI